MGHWPGQANNQKTTFGNLSRSELMSRVRSTGNQTTETRLKILFRKEGIKGWRRHIRLPGKPDFAWPELGIVLFVDGCFWHGHNCGKNLFPKTNPEEWLSKIAGNKRRDRRVNRQLRKMGWSVLRVWECQLREPEFCLNRIKKALSSQRIRNLD